MCCGGQITTVADSHLQVLVACNIEADPQRARRTSRLVSQTGWSSCVEETRELRLHFWEGMLRAFGKQVPCRACRDLHFKTLVYAAYADLDSGKGYIVKRRQFRVDALSDVPVIGVVSLAV